MYMSSIIIFNITVIQLTIYDEIIKEILHRDKFNLIMVSTVQTIHRWFQIDIWYAWFMTANEDLPKWLMEIQINDTFSLCIAV